MLDCFFEEGGKAKLQVVACRRTHWIELTIELLFQFVDFFLITFQFLCEFLSFKDVAFVSKQHFGHFFITVKANLLHPSGSIIKGGLIVEIEDYDRCLGMGKVVVDHSAIPLMPSSIPEFERVGFSLVGDLLQQDVDADSGVRLIVLPVCELEDEGGLTDRYLADNNCFDKTELDLLGAMTHQFKSQYLEQPIKSLKAVEVIKEARVLCGHRGRQRGT